ncbi:hypothetical protein DMC64_18785 [Amycolatopsis sp. WAC 04197]|nr:hypothetical protein DMC64_18785 [Amycolatopsis sp. WAC 04197]
MSWRLSPLWILATGGLKFDQDLVASGEQGEDLVDAGRVVVSGGPMPRMAFVLPSNGVVWLVRERVTGREWCVETSDMAREAGGYEPRRFKVHVIGEQVVGAPDVYPPRRLPRVSLKGRTSRLLAAGGRRPA